MVPNTRNKTDEERTIDRLCREIEILSKLYDEAAGYYYCAGLATMGIIFLAIFGVLELLK